MRLTCAGAAQTVTGSCHLFETRGKRILVDCGLFQGPDEIDRKNREDFPFDPASLDVVLVTHGHLDHVGRLPLLVKKGFTGEIHAAGATRDIAGIILRDSAKIQVEDFARAMRRARRRGETERIERPLYDDDDAERTLDAFTAPIDFGADVDLGDGITARFHPAGHILGSAFIEIESPDGRVVFSGDLGNRESGVQEDAVLPPPCDAVVVESTYGNRTHRGLDATLAEFREVLTEAVGRGGKVLIPSFALERTQNVLYWIRRSMEDGSIPEVPVFLDSPMATRVTRLYLERENEFLPEIRDAIDGGERPFEPAGLQYTVTADESRKINDLDGPAIVVAGSGMMSGGRIVHHLKHHLWKPETSLIVVGYQAYGTLGRRLVDGARKVRIHGEHISVAASIHTINGFSAHADQDDLLDWLDATGDAEIYLVHGERRVMDELAGVLHDRGRRSMAPIEDRTYELG